MTMPNPDEGNSIIYRRIIENVKKNDNFFFIKSMGSENYLSMISHVDLIIGNSSSGVLEMPSFKKFSINIGDRQSGRIKANSVIDCDGKTKNIKKAIKFSTKPSNLKKIKDVKNPYGTGGASQKIIDILKKQNLSNLILKGFFNLQ